MKTKILLSILAVGFFVNAFSQKPTMELTFTAENNGQYVPLDSIFIKNLTQGGDTMLYAPDTTLLLEYIVGITNNDGVEKNSFFVSQNYPNPFEGKTTVNLYLPEKEHIRITIRDIVGREVAFFENTLISGNHSFTFYIGKEKYYLFTAKGNSVSKTIKMVNINSNNKIQCKLVYNGFDNNIISFKSQKAINNFVFNPGDDLQYIGYAKTIEGIAGSDVIEDAPQNNKIYIFEIIEGIPCPGIPTVTDEDGNVYNTVLIGNQCWLKENLNVGTRINGSQNMSNNGTIEKFCYDDNEANCDEYGALYQWNEMMQYTTQQGTQGICPNGWHLPSYDEWTTLTDFLGGSSVAGGKMKEVGTAHWKSPNTGATNSSGFTGLPGGNRHSLTGSFHSLIFYGQFWSSSESSSSTAWHRMLYYNGDGVYSGGRDKGYGYSVRCLKD